MVGAGTVGTGDGSNTVGTGLGSHGVGVVYVGAGVTVLPGGAVGDTGTFGILLLGVSVMSPSVWQLGKKACETILAVWPRVELLFGRK